MQLDFTVTMGAAKVYGYFDTERGGGLRSGTSQTFDFLDARLPHWWAEIERFATGESEELVLVTPSGSYTCRAEQDVIDVVGEELSDVLLTAWREGVLAPLPRVERCFLGVTEFEGMFEWGDDDHHVDAPAPRPSVPADVRPAPPTPAARPWWKFW